MEKIWGIGEIKEKKKRKQTKEQTKNNKMLNTSSNLRSPCLQDTALTTAARVIHQ